MKSLYESILDTDIEVQSKVDKSVLDYVQKAFDDSDLSRFYRCEWKDNKVYVTYSRPGIPAIWEAISYNVMTETLFKGKDTAYLPLNIFELCVFDHCMIRIKTDKVVLTNIAAQCSYSHIYLCPDSNMETSNLHKYFSEIAKNANSANNTLYIDPVWNNTMSKDCSFLEGISFKNFVRVRLTFNVDALTLKDISAKCIVLGTWSVVKPNRYESFYLHDYQTGADWETEEQSKLIDSIIHNNNFISFGVNTNHVQHDEYFIWNKKDNLYDTKLLETDKIRVPKVGR